MGDQACGSCGRRVWWVVTDRGARMPLDPGAHPMGVVEPRFEGGNRARIHSKAEAQARRLTGAELYMPHHATCPSVERHRGVSRAQLGLFG